MYLCPKYNYVTGCCNSCINVVLQSQCKKKISLINVLNSDTIKYQIVYLIF